MVDPSNFWRRVEVVSQAAHDCGALVPIPTRLVAFDDGGLRFVVRVVESLARKPGMAFTAGGAASANPFLPYDPRLYVGDVSPTHVCLLNKFNVAHHHLLVVTRDFQPQVAPIDRDDFVAVADCMAACEAAGMDTIAFYNSGRDAGASQPHKHLQIIPLWAHGEQPRLPIESWLRMTPMTDKIDRLPRLPFRHGIAVHADGCPGPAVTRGEQDAQCYGDLLRRLGTSSSDGARSRPPPYNLLWTRRWMLLVPRRVECFHGISLNALAFAGALLVKDDDDLDVLRRAGPLSALVHVTLPW